MQGSVSMYLRPTSSGLCPLRPHGTSALFSLSHLVPQHLPLEGSPGCLAVSYTSVSLLSPLCHCLQGSDPIPPLSCLLGLLPPA